MGGPLVYSQLWRRAQGEMSSRHLGGDLGELSRLVSARACTKTPTPCVLSENSTSANISANSAFKSPSVHVSQVFPDAESTEEQMTVQINLKEVERVERSKVRWTYFAELPVRWTYSAELKSDELCWPCLI